MSSLGILAQGLGVAYAAGINVPATVAILGLAQRQGWIGHLPAGLDVIATPWIIVLASAIYTIEFLVTLLPGLASIWETFQSLVRPVAAAVLAAATVYHVDPAMTVPAVLLGGGLAATTHGTKLGLRYAVDASPEPVTNAVANLAELGTIASVALAVWHHPYLTLALALTLLVILMLVVRRIVLTLRRLLSGDWYRAARSSKEREVPSAR
jgi:heme exporter protein D